ncbi:hypothetical protein Mgra_00000882 [Meloidogyne graminicola]|uniref:Uncharacterized protein n=1 Tax=Meloidogyne graminicola TaxID=189291 RepID=A0A8T0A1Y1_9BILA|nr:hypothetical protein Mgra_00000882 [Meloidogyne graminicola]
MFIPFLFIPSIFLQFIFINLINSQQHQSFANTKFELPESLPEEDIQIEANQDIEAKTVITNIPIEQTTTTTIEQTTTTTELITTTTTTTLPPPTTTTTTTNKQLNTQKTPLPVLPKLVQLPRFIEGGNVQPITVPPSLVENEVKTLMSISPSPLQKVNKPSTIKQQQNILSNKSTSWRVIDQKIQSWFKQDYDISNCPKGSETMAKSFRLKFPPNLLKNKKEKILAELLAVRLKECLKKQRSNYWIRMEKKLKIEEKIDENEREFEGDISECREGLIQEQIACMNVYAFSCQFIQPNFPFRLVPTRIIVQEARLAEDGAEKCKKFTAIITVNRNLKRQAQSI